MFDITYGSDLENTFTVDCAAIAYAVCRELFCNGVGYVMRGERGQVLDSNLSFMVH